MRPTTTATVLVACVALACLAATAAGENGAPPVCKCSGGGTCAPAQLVYTPVGGTETSCPLPSSGILNASITTSNETLALTLDLTGVTAMLGYLSVEDAPRLTAVIAPNLVSVVGAAQELGGLFVLANPLAFFWQNGRGGALGGAVPRERDATLVSPSVRGRLER
jgi:hypothetical protein